MISTAGPDVPEIRCYVPDGCCGPSPCAMTADEFICAIRALLPEGDLYNNTLPPTPQTPAVPSTITIGCARIGCEQLVFGGCCDTGVIPCDIEPVAPQLAVVDAFSAVAYSAIQALCQMLRELDPCTAKLTIRRWAARFGIVFPDPCEGEWSDEVLATLICLVPQIRLHVINWDFLTQLAARFGAKLTLHYAGDFNCGPLGWWTMARTADVCPVTEACNDFLEIARDENCAPRPICRTTTLIRLESPCVGLPQSLNLVLTPTDIMLAPNCNFPPLPATLPHDPELYQALKWLLPRILPRPTFWCVYEADPANCIV